MVHHHHGATIMKHFLSSTLLLSTLIVATGSAQAFEITDMLGSKEKAVVPTIAAPSATDAVTSAFSKEVDAVAGEGTAGMVTGTTNPVIGLAMQQLGIPSEYAPQLQALYANFTADGNVTSAEVSEQQGLMSWLDKSPSMDANGLAQMLTTLFTKS
jgi:hypothetical protein